MGLAILVVVYGIAMLTIGGLFVLWGFDKIAPDLYAEFKQRINDKEET